jgi:integrase
LDRHYRCRWVSFRSASTWQRPPIEPFSQEEVDAILFDMTAQYPAQIVNLVEAWMFTGMRTSEIFALRWDNVDLVDSTALVSEALVRGELKGSTKTNVARTVRLNSRAAGAIQRQRQYTQTVGSTVFQDPRYGTAWSQERAFRRSFWEPSLKRLKLPYRRPYNMRHTYATLMLMAGMKPAFCARQLGHSVEIFHSTYAKWIDGEADAGEMALLERSITRARDD